MKLTIFFLFTCNILFCSAVSAQTIPAFRLSECPFQITEDAGAIRCGIVSVLADRNNSNSSYIDLSVAVLKARNKSVDSIPVVYLHGGPGSSALRTAHRFFNSELRENADLILFDQRGSRFSGSFCRDIGRDLFSLILRDTSLDTQAAGLAKVVKACQDDMEVKGIDFRHYKTSIIAADLEDIRQALNVTQWNVWGVSYGTSVGMAAAHKFPEGIRSLVLDSVSPNSPDWRSRTGRNFEISLNRVFELCDKSASCSNRFNSLQESYQQALERLDEQPLTTADGKVALNKHDFILIVHQLLYGPKSIEYIPLIIEMVKNGNKQFAKNITMALRGKVIGKSLAVYYAIDCQGRGLESQDLLDSVESVSHLFPLTAQHKSVCEALNVNNIDTQALATTKSTVPTLILAGNLDPITPPITAFEVVNDFSKASIVEFPYLGHGVSLGNECARGIMLSFIENPERSIDESCLADIKPVNFTTHIFDKPEIFILANDIFKKNRLDLIFFGVSLLGLLTIGLIYLIGLCFQDKAEAKDISNRVTMNSGARLVIVLCSLILLTASVGSIAYVGATNKFLLLFGLPSFLEFLWPLMWVCLAGGVFWLFCSLTYWVKFKRLSSVLVFDILCSISVISMVVVFGWYDLI